MPRSYDVNDQAALDAHVVSSRMLVRLDLAQGVFGFWTGIGILAYGGVNYVGAGSLLSIEGIKQSSDLSSVQVVGRLTGIANSDLTPDVLASIETYTYHQRECIIYSAYFNESDTMIGAPEIEFRGYIDRIVHTDNADGQAAIEVHLESRFRDHQKSGYRVRSDQDQRNIDPTDEGMRHVTKVSSEKVTFGKVSEATAQQTFQPQKKASGISGLINRIFG
jgi:hypothetical protein